VLTRQKLGFIDREKYASASGLRRGAYVLAEDAVARPAKAGARKGAGKQRKKPAAPDVVLMSSGSEVALILAAHERLAKRGIRARVVSVPSHELFAAQKKGYRESVLPSGVPRLAIEAAHPMAWHRWVGDDGIVLGLERYGASAPYETIYEELGLTVEKVVRAAAGLLR
jgi:transketolase